MNQQYLRHTDGGSKESPTANHRLTRRRSDVRHSSFREAYVDRTIRAVTPEPTGNGADITALPSPTSFPSQNPNRRYDATPSVSNTDEEGAIESMSRRKVKKKLKYKETTHLDTSPNSFFEKTRKRLGSITTSSQPASRQDDATLSIGFPSVVQASVFPDFQGVKQQLPHPTHRTFSSEMNMTATSPSVRSPIVLEADADKILKLMKTLCGRMHGILFYRPIGTTSWHSGYCAINLAPGSLVCQHRGDVTSVNTLIPDLRGCTVRTHYDPDAQTTHLSVTLPLSGFGYQLRPSVPETFDSWLAALLCWQPLKPKGIYNKMAKPQSISMTDRNSAGSRRLSEIATPKSTAVVKSSQLLLWDGILPAGSLQNQPKRVRVAPYEQSSWRRVNCTLHENGTLRLFAEESAIPLRTLKLNNLARCAIQRLDGSLLGAKNCIAVYTQYTASSLAGAISKPLVLSLTSRVAFEAWFVLLQAMTVPELYGPELDADSVPTPKSSGDSQQPPTDMFRIERSLQVRIIEVKFSESTQHQEQHILGAVRPPAQPVERQSPKVYADIMLGQDLRARTVSKPLSSSIFWAEDFCLTDMPSVISRASMVLKVGNPDEREWTTSPKTEDEMSPGLNDHDLDGIEVATHDPVYGRVDVPLSDLEQDSFVEKWWPVLDGNGIEIGQALIKFNLEGNVVLMESQYADLLGLLHNFDNSLTSQLGQVLGTELKQLSDLLLDIFQTSDKVESWINNLIEEEIDGIYREQPPTTRMRFSGRIRSNDSYESAEQRELLVRDLSRSATVEANLLFRGNSLVTKALDAHMRRLGRDYLERTLGEKLRAIAVLNPSCEVDPNRVPSSEQLEQNWSSLIAHTSSVWQAIALSVSKCPPGIRMILKHIASCAEDRYGSFIRTVKYTSVSGFLFLRLFCPCILNPKLFGLLDGKLQAHIGDVITLLTDIEHPPERARRAFTLIAKALIVLANLSKFGQKEPWMEPMNRFIATATPDFKVFIDQICSWDQTQGKFHEPQYQAAMQVKQRLPLLSREGLPSLPFLLDAPRSLAVLVNLWLDNAPPNISHTGIDECVRLFHAMCLNLKQKVQDCMANAEAAPEPNSKLERQWQRMLSEQPKVRVALNPFEESYSEANVTALPQPPTLRKHSSRHPYSRPNEAVEEEIEVESPYEASQRMITNSTNSSSVSFEVLSDYRYQQATRDPEFSSQGKVHTDQVADITRNRI